MDPNLSLSLSWEIRNPFPKTRVQTLTRSLSPSSRSPAGGYQRLGGYCALTNHKSGREHPVAHPRLVLYTDVAARSSTGACHRRGIKVCSADLLTPAIAARYVPAPCVSAVTCFKTQQHNSRVSCGQVYDSHWYACNKT